MPSLDLSSALPHRSSTTKNDSQGCVGPYRAIINHLNDRHSTWSNAVQSSPLPASTRRRLSLQASRTRTWKLHFFLFNKREEPYRLRRCQVRPGSSNLNTFVDKHQLVKSSVFYCLCLNIFSLKLAQLQCWLALMLFFHSHLPLTARKVDFPRPFSTVGVLRLLSRSSAYIFFSHSRSV